MIIESKDKKDFFSGLDKIGVKNSISNGKSVLIKINLARPSTQGHPRTDSKLLSEVIEYVYLNNGTCAIAESANGYLKENLELEGLAEVISKYGVEIIDLDFEETEQVVINGDKHYIPKCLKNYGVRIGIPATSKRPQMIFSNNVKLFVGAVPRCMYQIDNNMVDWRPRVHLDLHKSVADIFSAIQKYSPFHFFINGGVAMDEKMGEFVFSETLIGTNAIEMDLYVLKKYYEYLEMPEYLSRIQDGSHDWMNFL